MFFKRILFLGLLLCPLISRPSLIETTTNVIENAIEASLSTVAHEQLPVVKDIVNQQRILFENNLRKTIHYYMPRLCFSALGTVAGSLGLYICYKALTDHYSKDLSDGKISPKRLKNFLMGSGITATSIAAIYLLWNR